jgi:hypothetical protein
MLAGEPGGAIMRQIFLLIGIATLLCLVPPAAFTAVAPLEDIVVAGQALTAEQIASLPSVHLDVAFDTEHGRHSFAFDGPLLWSVLDRAGALAAVKPRDHTRQYVLITGRDGYTALIALGEISPEFEAKQVILAEHVDGKKLGAEHLRIVVPGDAHEGRSVRDVARIVVVAP